MNDKISIMDIYQESAVDGIGFRTVIFCAGCKFRCKNCHNPQTWDMNNGYLVHIQNIYNKLCLESNILLSGVTFSGGEPMLQAKAFCELAKMIKSSPKPNIWCYTGYLFEEIINSQDEKLELLRNIDVLVDGRYIHELRNLSLPFRGSSNQRIINVQESLKQHKVVELVLNNLHKRQEVQNERSKF